MSQSFRPQINTVGWGQSLELGVDLDLEEVLEKANEVLSPYLTVEGTLMSA